MEPITNAAANGINSLWGIAPTVSLLLLFIIVLLYSIRARLFDAREERGLYRQTLKENTEAFNALKEIIRVALTAK
jgi:hypothetical protein